MIPVINDSFVYPVVADTLGFLISYYLRWSMTSSKAIGIIMDAGHPPGHHIST